MMVATTFGSMEAKGEVWPWKGNQWSLLRVIRCFFELFVMPFVPVMLLLCITSLIS